jgi:RNA polymerase sigma-70 factor (ECF subfamily)
MFDASSPNFEVHGGGSSIERGLGPALVSQSGEHRPKPLGQTAVADEPFQALYQAHFRLVWSALARLGVRESDRMDLTQKVFLVAFLKLPEFEGRSLVSTWLWGICRRVAIAHRRSSAVRYEVMTDPTQFDSLFVQPGDSPTQPSASQEVAVEEMLAKLSKPQRIVFELAEVDDLDGPQIATLLNISLGTVRSRLRYARQRIRRELKRLRVASAFNKAVAPRPSALSS